MTDLTLTPGQISLATLRRLARAPTHLVLDPAARPAIDAAAACVGRVIAEGRTVYGVNTGFGLLARTHIDADRLRELQVRLILSHSVGVGPGGV